MELPPQSLFQEQQHHSGAVFSLWLIDYEFLGEGSSAPSLTLAQLYGLELPSSVGLLNKSLIWSAAASLGFKGT